MLKFRRGQTQFSGRSIAYYLVIVLITALAVEGCNLGKKNCGCGMDLNGSYKKKRHWF